MFMLIDTKHRGHIAIADVNAAFVGYGADLEKNPFRYVLLLLLLVVVVVVVVVVVAL